MVLPYAVVAGKAHCYGLPTAIKVLRIDIDID
jgi:hypothetical protein